MIRIVISNIIRFTFLILIQALIVNRINILDGLVLPFVYIFAILMLPIQTPRLATLFIAFLTGLTMDMFTSTPGMHASACLVIGYVQPFILRFLSPREGYEYGQQPTIQSMGFRWYLIYASILVFVHHFVLFNIEYFRLSGILYNLSTIILSGIGTLILMIIGQYLIFKPKQHV